MKIVLDVTKSLEQNAGIFFDKSKKAKRKLEGAREALEKTRAKLLKAKLEVQKEKKVVVKHKKQWFEKFRWFFSSDGFLCVGGRDATTNEIVVKKHLESDDFVFHTDMAGSPFFVIKSQGKVVPDSTKGEVAQATASYSRAWKLGVSSAEVFMVNPDQVTKEANSGEFVPKGAFMIYGKRTYFSPKLQIAIGLKDGIIIGGPPDAVKKNSDKFVVLVQGKDKASVVGKKILKKLKGGELDDIIRFLPSGGYSLM